MQTDFEVYESSFLSFKEIKLINNNNGEYITVLPQLGARLNEVVLKKGPAKYSIIKNLESEDLTIRDNQFNNAKLFPFANRLEAGVYNFEGKEYQLELNYPEENNACHGFIFDKEFTLEETCLEQGFGELVFSYNYDGDVKGYPFRFRMLLIYKLDNHGKVECRTKIINKSDSVMPFADGWHHYFNLGRSVDVLSLSLEAEKINKLNKYGIPNGEFVMLSECDSKFLLEGQMLDTNFSVKQKEIINTRLCDKEEKIGLNVWQKNTESGYKYLNIYTPENRKSIAIEPMSSNINAFNNKEGLLTLAPSEEWTGMMGFNIS